MQTRVLVVDDEKNMRWVLAQALEGEGFEVQQAVDGKEALSAVAEQTPDIVTLNLMMLDGVAIEIIRSILSADRDARIMVIGALYQKALVLEALEVGARDFIVRPFDSLELVDIMRKVLASEVAFDLPAPSATYSPHQAG